MATAHNNANPGDIAKTVLMPGDPLRAKFIAETYLENIVQFNTVRNMLVIPGTIKEKEFPLWEAAWECQASASILMSCFMNMV